MKIVLLFTKYEMDIVCCVIGIILCIIAVIGSILPGLPGPQLGYIAVLLAQFFMNKPFSRGFIVIRGILMVLLMAVDYYLPILGTKKFGGTKWGNRGCFLGMVVGIFFGPLGLILGPFAGALIGEFLHKNNIRKSIMPAFGAFLGFVSGIVLKLVISIILLVYFCIGCYNHFFLTLDSFPIGTYDFTSLL